MHQSQVKLGKTSVTHVMPEHFRDES